MALDAGTRLGPYEITAQIGAGGMGEVYRAHDPKLNRDVALKVLPEDFAQDPERLARFKREAQVLASLNHPNIAAIYGLEDSGETHALVLELVEGPTLQDRISQGAIPLDEALPIAKQIAEALEAAHEQGIIHRDLKPANIKVTPEGVVKVLDFGLAKALEPEQTEAEAANSPTMTAAATKMGVLMGTAAYMSPEQARGKTVDRRTDIWAFGVVLFEMLTGRRLFEGATVSDTLAAVLRADPIWEDLPSTSPPGVRRLLRRCLERRRRHRTPDIAVARIEIEEALATPGDATAETSPPVQSALWQRPVGIVATAVVTLVLGGLGVWSLTRPAPGPPAPVTRTSIVLPETQLRYVFRGVAISPTGTHVAYLANDRIYLRALDEFEAQPLAGTEGSVPRTPFFSPDGQWIGFFSMSERAVKKVALSGGAPVTLARGATAPSGGSWGVESYRDLRRANYVTQATAAC